MGRASPPKVMPSDGDAAPMLIGCVWMVPRHGASCLASSDGSISPCCAAPHEREHVGLPWGAHGVFVIRCQKLVRSRTRLRQRGPGRRGRHRLASQRSAWSLANHRGVEAVGDLRVEVGAGRAGVDGISCPEVLKTTN